MKISWVTNDNSVFFRVFGNLLFKIYMNIIFIYNLSQFLFLQFLKTFHKKL